MIHVYYKSGHVTRLNSGGSGAIIRKHIASWPLIGGF